VNAKSDIDVTVVPDRFVHQAADSIFKQLAPASSPGLTGRSSIPETARAHTRYHGVLDAPLEAGHDNQRTHLRDLAAHFARVLLSSHALSN
jgi:hypothetical protein